PPSTMYVFNEDTPTLVYANLENDIPLPICGVAPSDVPIGCCVSSLDLPFTDNYHSVLRNYIKDWTNYTPPISANAHSYCTISTADYSSFLGMNQAYYLGTNTCFDNVVCDLDGKTLTVYNDTGCGGFYESFSILDPLPYNSSILGNISVGLQVINDGIVPVKWTAYSPQYELVPQFIVPME
ncbi:hypothetical protein HDV01_003882, partial [Terramyces sp. JEL0728]